MNHSLTRVAILATSEKTHQRLSSLLKDAGLNVVSHDLPSDDFLQQLEDSSPDVLLVDLSEENGSETEIIDTLLDYDALPIFFNDSSPAGGGANALWAKKLARKLSDTATRHTPLAEPTIELSLEPINEDESAAEAVYEPASQPEPTAGTRETNEVTADDTQARVDTNIIETTRAEPTTSIVSGEQAITETATLDTPASMEKPQGAAVNIWVLGASLGGPQAVRQFLAAVEADLPVAFVLAQHIGANHISLLAEQLNRVTAFTVLAGRPGHLIRHHEVVLTPADKNIKITNDGYLSFTPATKDAIYSPSIDNAMEAVAQHYGDMAGTIIFSGMGDDGARGCEAMAKHGGIIWAQDVDSCVISSMPDQARKTNTVTFSANPQALAQRLYQYYRD